MFRSFALMFVLAASSLAEASPFASRPSVQLPDCGGQASLVKSNFGPKLILTRVNLCSNVRIDGTLFKMFKADDGLYYFEMTFPDWDEKHEIHVASNTKRTRDEINFRKYFQQPAQAKPFPRPNDASMISAVNACHKAFYDSKNSLTCIDFAKRHRISGRAIESCSKVFFNNQNRLRCIQANRQPIEIEACGTSYGGEDSKALCVERYAKNYGLTPDIVRACITAFNQSEFQLQCMDSSTKHRTAALSVIRSCETNYFGDSQRMVCVR